MNNIGITYSPIVGVTQFQFRKLLLRAIESKNADAIYNLTEMAKGISGVFLNQDELIKIYNIAIALGSTDAMCKLADIYYNDRKYSVEDKQYAIILYHNAADLKNKEAMYQLAKIYFVEKNYADAIKFMKMACHNNHEQALCFMTLYYDRSSDDIYKERTLHYLVKALNVGMNDITENISQKTCERLVRKDWRNIDYFVSKMENMHDEMHQMFSNIFSESVSTNLTNFLHRCAGIEIKKKDKKEIESNMNELYITVIKGILKIPFD